VFYRFTLFTVLRFYRLPLFSSVLNGQNR